ncbi:MAG: RDD family protein, partial [Actinomycetota bacterium]|nr:RDD family protein [Actinomycetota bacterium]
RVAEAPEVRSAITSQGVGLLEDVRRSAREFARKLDDESDRVSRRVLRRPQRRERPLEAGAATRLLAIGLDALILNGILLVISTLLTALIDSVFSPDTNQTVTIAFGAFAWLIASALYLGAFWTLAERTPGMTFVGLRIRDPGGGHVPPPQDLRRLLGFYLAAIPFGLGFKGILFRDDRRGWHDRFAGTVVLYADPEIDRGVEVEGHIREPRQRPRASRG